MRVLFADERITAVRNWRPRQLQAWGGGGTEGGHKEGQHQERTESERNVGVGGEVGRRGERRGEG